MRMVELARLFWQSQRKMIIFLALLGGLNLILIFSIEQFLVPKVADQENYFLRRQSEVRQLLHNKGQKAETPEQYFVSGRQDLERFRLVVPHYQEFTGLIEELLVLSNRANLKISQISYDSEELNEIRLLKLTLKFNVSGNYEQVKKFIHSLEQSVRLITINQISLQESDDNGVNLSLNLETFFRPGGDES